MRRAILLLATSALTACGGSGPPATTLSGDCSGDDALTFAPLTSATVEAALGAGSVRASGLVFPGKTTAVPASGNCSYTRGPSELTVALNRKTPFFASAGEARRLQGNALARPI